MREEVIEILRNEIELKFSRSSGPGGQNVNKVNSKVSLRWEIDKSSALSVSHRMRFREKYKNQISDDGVFQLSADESRDQHKNREVAFKKLLKLIQSVSLAPKRRVKTKPSKGAVERRLTEKKKRTERKSNRKKDWG